MAIPQKIKQLANKVRTEIYGKDVRESIAESMEESGRLSDESNERSKNTVVRQDHLEDRYDIQVGQLTEDSEVIDARMDSKGNLYPLLGKRLDESENKLEETIVRSESFIGSSAFETMQDAIDGAIASKSKLKVPSGVYSFDAGLVIDGKIDFEGSMNDVVFDFTAMTSGTAITFGDENSISALVISGLRMTGTPNLTAMRLNGSGDIKKPITDSAFRDMRIQNFGIGLSGVYSWTLKFDNVRFQNCRKVFELGSQVNNVEFSRTSLVSSNIPSTFSNCEGINFTSPNIANVTGNVFNLFQSSMSIVNPYYEYIEGYLAVIGGTNEIIKSTLSAFGGISTDKVVKIAIEGDRNSLMLKNLGKNAEYVVENRQSSSITPNNYSHSLDVDRKFNTDDFLVLWNGNDGLTPFQRTGSSSMFRADVQEDGYALMNNDTGSTAGIRLHHDLVVGNNYTLIYAMRKNINDSTTIRFQGVTSNTFSTGDINDPFEMRYLPFVAGAAILEILWGAGVTLEASFIGIVEGSHFPNIPKSEGVISDTKPPTNGNWRRGTRVYNSLPLTNGMEGWVCVESGVPGNWKEFGMIRE